MLHLLTCALFALLPQQPAEGAAADPKKGEVALGRTGDWDAFLLWRGGVEAGVWSVQCVDLFREYGCPEVVGLDDKGRVVALVSYSGKWTPLEAVHDGAWLGAQAHLDLDPRVPGPELYVGGRSGTLYRVTPFMGAHAAPRLDSVEIAHLAGDEIHTLVGGNLLPSASGAELLVFTLAGQVYSVRPEGAGGAAFTLARVGEVGGRVRDAVVLPAAAGAAPWIATVSRAGDLILVRRTERGLDLQPIAHEDMGLGRVALRPGGGEGFTLYATRDDGAILRFARERAGAPVAREVIYAGPQGPRGIVAGRFHADPEREAVAVSGYGRRVEILARKPGAAWEVETVFVDQHQGHWLARAEVDGRNATDELLVSGFGGQIVLLSRRPGYGLPGVPVPGVPADAPASRPASAPAPGTGAR